MRLYESIRYYKTKVVYVHIYICILQLPAYVAQVPTLASTPEDPIANMSEAIQTLSPPTPTAIPDSSLSCNSDYQDAVLLGRYPETFRIATLNCRGLASISKRERVIHLMTKHNIDILCLQETKINSNSKEEHDGFVMYWSSGVKDDSRNKAEDLKRSGRARRNNQQDAQTFRNAIEHLGVGIVFKRKIQRYVVDVIQKSARTIVLALCMRTGRLGIVSTYVPQACHTDQEATDKHYHELEDLMDMQYAFSPKLILGDFNARILKALPHETGSIGPFTFGASWADLDLLSQAQLNNRARFVEFCLEKKMVVKNTFFHKPDEQLITYKAVGVQRWLPPWTLHKYAQMDFILINDKWKNSVTNVFTSHVHAVDTDHKLLIADIRFKLKSKKHDFISTAPRYRNPSQQQLIDFNQGVSDRIAQQGCSSLGFQEINDILTSQAKSSLPRRPPQQKKEYISASTWQLLESKWAALETGNLDYAEKLSFDIKNQVKLDRETHLLAQLEEITLEGYKWDGLKKIRAKFTPSFTKLKDAQGNHVPFKEYPHKAADYLEKVQWKAAVENPNEESRQHVPLQNGSYLIDDSPFTNAELDLVLSKLKRNKSPGADGVSVELFKWLNAQNRLIVLDAANCCLQNGYMQPEDLQAIVASIYKKGDSSLLSNYRPISLLNSCYKVVAALVKIRLDAGLDTWLMQTQYGFRKSKSTSQAIFVARRLQDISEKSRSSSTLILLDWEKAFDKVSHKKLIETLHRLLVPEKIVTLISSFYCKPQFKVKAGADESTWRTQMAGIRQGCPLSPYLFVLLMGALFSDLKRELCTKRQQEPIDGIHFAEVLYADDTLIFGANTHCINVLLHAIERHSKYFGLQLNYEKCVNITANQRTSSVRFSPDGPAQGRLVPRKHAASYLGSLLTDSFDNRAEILNRLGDCIATANRMKVFWNKANTSVRWKLQVLNAIIRSKLFMAWSAFS